MKEIVLMPRLSGDLYEIVKIVSKKPFFMVNLEKAIERIKRHDFSKVFVIIGAKNRGKVITSRGVHRVLKRAFKKLDVRVIDTFDWGIKGQIVLAGPSISKQLREALSEL